MPKDKMLAEWFWTDRWVGSSAFLLPVEARGVYREMLTQAWRRGAQLPNDHEAIRRATGVTESEWGRCWPKIAKYWRVDGDVLVNDTQIEVYSEAKRRQEAASHRGELGAQARAQVRAQVEPEHTHKSHPPSPSPSPSPSPDLKPEPIKVSTETHTAPKNGAAVVDERFERFWAAYPKRKARGQALKEWKKLRPSEAMTEVIIAAVLKQAAWPEWRRSNGQYIPHPSSWLHQGRWDDEPGGRRSLLSDVGQQNELNSQEALRLMEEQDAKH